MIVSHPNERVITRLDRERLGRKSRGAFEGAELRILIGRQG
jgi:hypothetical protein